MLGAREGVRRLGAREGVRRRGVREGVRRRGVREGALQPLGEWGRGAMRRNWWGDFGEIVGSLRGDSRPGVEGCVRGSILYV